MIRLVLVVACLAWSTVASAQTHPCEASPPTIATKGSKIGWCTVPEDVDLTWRISINGNLSTLVGVQQVGSPSPVSGLVYLEAPLPVVSKGTYPVAVLGTNGADTGPASDQVIWQVGGPPSKPVKPRIVQ